MSPDFAINYYICNGEESGETATEPFTYGQRPAGRELTYQKGVNPTLSSTVENFATFQFYRKIGREERPGQIISLPGVSRIITVCLFGYLYNLNVG